MNILFVCRGNVGRSQLAAHLFKEINDKHTVLSAGTRVRSPEGESRHGQLLKDLPAAENVIIVLKDRGIDVSNVARTQLDENLVDWADKIVVMAEMETIPEYLMKSPKMIYWKIDDPKGTALEAHRVIASQLETLVRGFVEEYKL